MWRLLLLLLALPAWGQEIWVDPAELTVHAGDTAQVAVYIDADTLDILAGSFKLAFDGTLMWPLEAAPGTWITDSGLPPFFWHDWGNQTLVAANCFWVDFAFLGGQNGGTGELAVFTFLASGPGETPLIWEIVDFRDYDNNTLPFESVGGFVTVISGDRGAGSTWSDLKALYD